MRIKCTNGTPLVDMLDRLPPLPLSVNYGHTRPGFPTRMLTEKDELGIYHALRLHDRVYHIDLELRPSILYKVILLRLDRQFPKLEHLSLTFSASSRICKNNLPLTLPKAFLAPNLRHLFFFFLNPLSCTCGCRTLCSTYTFCESSTTDVRMLIQLLLSNSPGC